MTYCGCEFGPALTRELEQSFPNRICLCSLLLSSYGSSGFLVLCQKNIYFFFSGVLEFAHIDWSGQKWVEEMLLAASSTCVSCEGAVLWEIDTKPRLCWVFGVSWSDTEPNKRHKEEGGLHTMGTFSVQTDMGNGFLLPGGVIYHVAFSVESHLFFFSFILSVFFALGLPKSWHVHQKHIAKEAEGHRQIILPIL